MAARVSQLLSKFQGALVGALVGDCFGSKFEGHSTVTWTSLIATVENLESPDAGEKRILSYTDDTAMRQSVETSLLEHKAFNAKDMAKRFTEEYFHCRHRNYGGHVKTVFQTLKHTDYKDVFSPAQQQFNGRGSYGNGGAMRISPAALFMYNEKDPLKLKELVENITKLTHTHVLALNGAYLESCAVKLALKIPSSQPLDADKFIDELIRKMKPLEDEHYQKNIQPLRNEKFEQSKHPYCYKLERIRELLKKEDAPVSQVVAVLGNDVSALESVPAAVYSFLVATHDSQKLQNRNGFERTIIIAISLGGDTDTIASMAGAIAGAYYGLEEIPKSWQLSCEGLETAVNSAKELYKHMESTK